MRLLADKLSCVRGGRTVFTDISFALAAGEALLLTGPNGAGKTSLLRVIASFILPAAGSVQVEGVDDDLTVGQRCHYIGHTNAIKTALSVEENLDFWTDFCGLRSSPGALETFDLSAHASVPAALLSAGQRRRLALSRLAAVPRPIWLLDEPTVGLDAASQTDLVGLMQAHLANDGIVIATSHVDIGLEFTTSLTLGGAGS
jgi:heme exporter protein A